MMNIYAFSLENPTTTAKQKTDITKTSGCIKEIEIGNKQWASKACIDQKLIIH